MKRTLARRTALVLLILATFLAMPQQTAAQESTGVQELPAAPESSTGRSAGISGSASDRLLASMRNAIGFSFGAFEIHTPNASSLFTPGDKSPTFTMLRPRLFANAGGGRSAFQLDYSMGYRRYNRRGDIQSSDHSGIASFEYKMSRYTVLTISDTFRSMFNDYGALPDVSAPTLYQPGFAQQLYIPRQRTTTNSLTAGVSYQAGRRTNLNFYGSYDLWRFRNSTFGNTQGFQAGIRAERQLNQWLFLQSSYSHYLTEVDPRLEPASIQRLQAGGLKLKLRRNTEIYASGGLDYTRFQRQNQPAASYQAGLSRSTESSMISIVYHRGLSNTVSPQVTTFAGHVATLSISQWLSQRFNVQLHSSYNRGVSPNRNISSDLRPNLEYIAATARIDLVLQRHVLFSTEYAYVSQRGRNLSAEVPLLNRHTITSGLEFYLPSLGKRPRGRVNEVLTR